MKGIFFLLRQYLKPKLSIISVLTYLSLLGPLVGVSVLVVITSVMNGFPIAFQEKIIEFESDVSIIKNNNGKITEPNKIIKQLALENIQASPVTNFYGFIQNDDEIIPIQAKGIYPQYDLKVSQLKKYITNGRYDINTGECLIGRQLAYKNNLSVGDSIILHSPQRYASLIKLTKNTDSKLVEANQTLTIKIVGFFSYGHNTVDNNFIYIHIDDANDMVNLSWGEAQEIETSIPNPFNAIEVAQQFTQKSYLQRYHFIPWQYKHKDYHETVQREKALITFTLFFIMGGAAIGIAATLFSLIIQKTKEIGILKSLGVSKKSIIAIFLCLGSFIGILGSVLGWVLGLIIITFRNEIFKSLWNPKAYFLDEIPSLIIKQELIIIIIAACLICILGALLPALFAAFIKPVSALHTDK